MAASTYIHVQIPFNFTQILDTKNTIEQNYDKLLDKREEPFKNDCQNYNQQGAFSQSWLQLKISKTSSKLFHKPPRLQF